MRFLVSMSYAESDEGALVVVDMRSEKADLVLRYTPPSHLVAPGKGFTGGCWTDAPGESTLVVCGFAGVYRIDPHTWRVTGILHQPCMNDLHHVSAHAGRLYIANTGIDAVDVIDSESGGFLGSHACQPAWLAAHRLAGRTPARADWDRLLTPGWTGSAMDMQGQAVDGDYYGEGASPDQPFHQRRVRDFVHPNHLAVVGERLLCTRLADRSVVDMRRFETTIAVAAGHPHDGVVREGRFWLTSTNGLVLAYDMQSANLPWPEIARHDVFSRTGRAGWCRGLVVTDAHFIVGVTRVLGSTRYPWNDRHPALTADDTESSILCIDRGDGRLVARVDLSDPRSSKIYSILELP